MILSVAFSFTIADCLHMTHYLLTHWPLGDLNGIVCGVQSNPSYWWLRYFLHNCLQVNVTRHHWWLNNIGSGNALAPPGKKTFTWANADPDLCPHMASLGSIDLIYTWYIKNLHKFLMANYNLLAHDAIITSSLRPNDVADVVLT